MKGRRRGCTLTLFPDSTGSQCSGFHLQEPKPERRDRSHLDCGSAEELHAPLVRALERCPLAKKIPDATLYGGPSVETTDIWPNLDYIHLSSSEMTSLWLCLCSGAPILGPNQSMTSAAEVQGEKQDGRLERKRGGRRGGHEKVMYLANGTHFPNIRGRSSVGRVEFIGKDRVSKHGSSGSWASNKFTIQTQVGSWSWPQSGK